ncbi:hypothetical protein AJ79_07180 [Helicocarpus griseus UAMH5409]|uniref:Uncharacterized protein n=1 Tax=Helicocarpus griseus UAMH5409 TaxID=1447875 RepID=A0A2B7X5E7_9EURO|nr:hypothetical protein AJ79_07180 [Helicocarpus griseus UAMH5409]
MPRRPFSLAIPKGVMSSPSGAVDPGDAAPVKSSEGSVALKTARRLRFSLSKKLESLWKKKRESNIPAACRRATVEFTVVLGKVKDLTGQTQQKQRPVSMPLPTAATDGAKNRFNARASRASKDYGQLVLNLPYCEDDDHASTVHPLRMNPVVVEEDEQHEEAVADVAPTPAIAVTEEVDRESQLEASSLTTAAARELAAVVSEEASSPSSQKEAANDSDSEKSVVSPGFPFRELSMSSWATAPASSVDPESLPQTPASPYRMGRARRYGWIEGQAL